MKNKDKFREVVCPSCNTINTIELPTLGGTVTFFCKNCGEENHLVRENGVRYGVKIPACDGGCSQASRLKTFFQDLF